MGDTPLQIRLLRQEDIAPIAAAFAAIGWDKPTSQYERYLAEQETGERTILVAFQDGIFVGYVTICWYPDYPTFREGNMPEIQDLNVLPDYQRQGIGGSLMDEAERVVGERSDTVGIGVGLYSDYGAAQRMYARRGYIPDGRGLYFRDHVVEYGEAVIAGHELTLQFTKRLTSTADG